MLFTTMLLCMSLHVQANRPYQYLTIETSDSKTTFALETLKLSISDGVLTATNSHGSRTFLLKDLIRMYFSESDATRITSLQISTKHTSDRVLFDIKGHRIMHPSKGIYIVKNNSKTQKVIVK